MLYRERCITILHTKAEDNYEAEHNVPMTSPHHQQVFEGLQWALTNLSRDVVEENSLFMRAASIGFFWAKRAPQKRFGHEALAKCIDEFLLVEGVKVHPSIKEKQVFLNKIQEVTKKFVTNTNKNGRLKDLFVGLHRVCAKHCICGDNNHRDVFKDKLCHQISGYSLLSDPQVDGYLRRKQSKKNESQRKIQGV